MNKDLAIKVKNISKVYKLYDNPLDRLKESINPFGKKYHKDFYALQDVSFEVKKGETVGIIGKNGSGKSTLLKIITGVLTPTDGMIFTNGKISSLLELGAGFNPDYTGLENIYLNGTIMGYSKEEIDERLDGILSFADIGDFVYQPVKMYSSGMFVRLAFAVAINVEPDILIIDEALAVGDIRFQQKCYRKIVDLKNNRTILFVSHDLGAITNFCDRVVWLNDGKKVDDDIPKKVIESYHAYMAYDLKVESNNLEVDNFESNPLFDIDPLPSGLSNFGEGLAKVIGVSLYNNKLQSKVRVLKGGEEVSLIVKINVVDDINSPIVGFIMKDSIGYNIIETNTVAAKYELEPLKKGKVLSIKFNFTFPNIKNGQYMFSIAIAEGTIQNHIQHHWVHDALIVEVRRPNENVASQGLCIIDDMKIELY